MIGSLKYRSCPFDFPWVSLGCLWADVGLALAPFNPFGLHLAVLWAPFGPFASLWGALGLPLAILWAHLAGLWSRFGALWEPVGSLGPPWAPPFKLQAQCSPFAMPVDKIKPPGTRRRSHGSHRSRGSHGSHGSGVKNCDSEPTSHTRRGPG